PAPFYHPGFAAPWPPKPRWIAPERKVAVIIISVVAALVLLGIGAVGGSLLGGHHDERFGPGARHPGYGQQFLPRNGNGRPIPVGPGIPSAPVPSTTS
ncbi:MAG: hypothetical protein M3O28_14160, partial [Actinomycetota bacterium]|nr:hypothetical protein [Actinomycetota bacterium]